MSILITTNSFYYTCMYSHLYNQTYLLVFQYYPRHVGVLLKCSMAWLEGESMNLCYNLCESLAWLERVTMNMLEWCWKCSIAWKVEREVLQSSESELLFCLKCTVLQMSVRIQYSLNKIHWRWYNDMECGLKWRVTHGITVMKECNMTWRKNTDSVTCLVVV